MKPTKIRINTLVATLVIIVLAVLKFFGVNISWWWVFSPVWIPIVILLVLFMIMVIITAIVVMSQVINKK